MHRKNQDKFIEVVQFTKCGSSIFDYVSNFEKEKYNLSKISTVVQYYIHFNYSIKLSILNNLIVTLLLFYTQKSKDIKRTINNYYNTFSGVE